MLDVMRANTKSWFMLILFALIIGVFVLTFNTGSRGLAPGAGDTSWAAKVNGEVITPTQLRVFSRMVANRGGQQPDLHQVLEGLEDTKLFEQQGQRLGISVSDSELAERLSYQWPNADHYTEQVQNLFGTTVDKYEALVRSQLLSYKAQQATREGLQVSDDEVDAFVRSHHESASITYVKFSPFTFRAQAQPTDAEATEWLKGHDKEAHQAYDKQKDARFTQAAATRVRAVTVPVASNATAEVIAAARKRIDDARNEVKSGKDIAEVAKAKSEDAVSRMQGGDLGFVAVGASPYGRTLEEQANKLKVGELSEVFKDRTGFHFLKAVEKRAATTTPFETAKKEIALDELRNEKAKQLAKQKASEALAQLKAGKKLDQLFPAKKEGEGSQFDLASAFTPQAADVASFHPYGGYVPGVGMVPQLSAAVFGLAKAGDVPAEPVEDGDSIYVFQIKSRERADLSKIDAKELKQAREQLRGQKDNEVFRSLVEKLRKDATIVENPTVFASQGGPSAPVDLEE